MIKYAVLEIINQTDHLGPWIEIEDLVTGIDNIQEAEQIREEYLKQWPDTVMADNVLVIQYNDSMVN